MKRVRMIIQEQLDNALAYPDKAQQQIAIAYASYLLNKYPDTCVRVNEDTVKADYLAVLKKQQ